MAKNDAASRAITHQGYTPANAEIWATLPPIRQIEAAYIAAENAAPGVGGDQMLALLARIWRSNMEQNRWLPAVRSFASRPETKPPVFKILPRLALSQVAVLAADAPGFQSLAKYLNGG